MGAQVVTVRPEIVPLLGYWAQLERVHRLTATAQRRVEATIGRPICMPDCGRCCSYNTIVCYGFEAEYVASWLLGSAPERLQECLDRCRAWLVAPGKWTYGRSLTAETLMGELRPELLRALIGRCPFLGDDKRCLIHDARPLVCRAYGVLHMPGGDCPRPIGLGETEDSRAWYRDDDPRVPVRKTFEALVSSVQEPRYSRQGFLPTLLFERFRATELAGLLDDGKVPLVKLHVGWQGTLQLLWQSDLEAQWAAVEADASIDQEVRLIWRDGQPIMAVHRDDLPEGMR